MNHPDNKLPCAEAGCDRILCCEMHLGKHVEAHQRRAGREALGAAEAPEDPLSEPATTTVSEPKASGPAPQITLPEATKARRGEDGLLYFDRHMAPTSHPQREIKVSYPSCTEQKMLVLGLPPDQACQLPHNIHAAWWVDCDAAGHQPYFSLTRQSMRRPQLVEDSPGRYKLLGYDEEEVWFEQSPNLTQITLSDRVNSGVGLALYSVVGYVLPEVIGVAPFCQFRDCWAQDIKIRHEIYGDYCSETQAKLIAADIDGIRLEVMTHDYALEKRKKQLAAINVR